MKKFLFTIGALLLSVSTASAGLTVTIGRWIKIIGEIVIALFSSTNASMTQDVIYEKSREYGIDECEIWKHGGFGHEDEMPKKCKKSTITIHA